MAGVSLSAWYMRRSREMKTMDWWGSRVRNVNHCYACKAGENYRGVHHSVLVIGVKDELGKDTSSGQDPKAEGVLHGERAALGVVHAHLP